MSKNLILSGAENLTMTSLEIAELTGKRHNHVVRDIDSMLKKLGLDAWGFSGTYKGAQGNEYRMFNLPSELALCLIGGYDAKSRMLIMSKLLDIDKAIAAIKDFEIPDDLPDMFVYAIRESETGRIKIGISRDPEQRLKQLQTGNSQTLELVAYKKAENRYKDETEYHQLNSANHVRGEWFSACATLN